MSKLEIKNLKHEMAVRITAFAGSLVILIGLAAPARAQIGGSAPASQGSQASQLPLSGRSGQSGGVVAGQSPVPGTTTSVNTLNPTVQV